MLGFPRSKDRYTLDTYAGGKQIRYVLYQELENGSSPPAVYFLFFSFANISFLGTSSFIGELLIQTELIKCSFSLASISSFGIILSAGYAIWLVNSLNFGLLKTQYFDRFQDISRREF